MVIYHCLLKTYCHHIICLVKYVHIFLMMHKCIVLLSFVIWINWIELNWINAFMNSDIEVRWFHPTFISPTYFRGTFFRFRYYIYDHNCNAIFTHTPSSTLHHQNITQYYRFNVVMYVNIVDVRFWDAVAQLVKSLTLSAVSLHWPRHRWFEYRSGQFWELNFSSHNIRRCAPRGWLTT